LLVETYFRGNYFATLQIFDYKVIVEDFRLLPIDKEILLQR
jgi:hypothetical protein